MTNKELASALNCRESSVRAKLQELKLSRDPNKHKWTPAEKTFLLLNFKYMGSVEIAENLTRINRHGIKFTRKMVYKKMRVMKLSRTKADLMQIRERNTKRGCWSDNSASVRVHSLGEGEIRLWSSSEGRFYKRVKWKGKLVQLQRVVWEMKRGPIPQDHCIIFIDGDTLNCRFSNLRCISKSEFAKIKIERIPLEVRINGMKRYWKKNREANQLKFKLYTKQLADLDKKLTRINSEKAKHQYTSLEIKQHLARLTKEKKELEFRLFMLPESVKKNFK